MFAKTLAVVPPDSRQQKPVNQPNVGFPEKETHHVQTDDEVVMSGQYRHPQPGHCSAADRDIWSVATISRRRRFGAVVVPQVSDVCGRPLCLKVSNLQTVPPRVLPWIWLCA